MIITRPCSSMIEKAKDEELTKRLEKFEERIIKLSVAIDDNKKNIDFLLDYIKSYQENTESTIKEENAKLRIKLNLANASFNQNFSKLLEEYANLTKTKEDMTTQIEELSKKKNQENDITKSILSELSHTLDGKMKDAFNEWNNNKDEREAIWLSKKVNHVRACTVDALQPEIKRLSLAHEAELGKLVDEAAVRRRYLEKEVDVEFNRELNNCVDVAEKRQNTLREGRMRTWRDQIKEMERSHLKQLEDIQTEAQLKLKERSSLCQVNDLEAKYKKELDGLKSVSEKDLKELYKRHNHLLQKIHVDLKLELDKIMAQTADRKEEWEESEKMKLTTKLNQKIKVLNERIQKRRNEDIEILLRSTHKAEVELEKTIATQKQQKRLLTSDDLDGKLKHIKEKNKLLSKQLTCITNSIENICLEQQRILEQVQLKEKMIVKAENSYTILIEAHKNFNFAENYGCLSIRAEIKDSDIKQSSLQDQIINLKRKLESLELNQDQEMKIIKAKHNETLNKKESKFLKQIKEKENDLHLINSLIKKMELKVDELRKILMKAYCSGQDK